MTGILSGIGIRTAVVIAAFGASAAAQVLQFADVQKMTPAPYDARVTYGTHPLALAAVTDLRTASGKVCGTTIGRLLGAQPDYKRYSPIELVPLEVPQWILEGDADTIVAPTFGADYETRARAAGDRVERRVFSGAGHFELTVPGKPAADAITALIADTMRSLR